MRWVDRLREGRQRSGNGASSFHLWWRFDPPLGDDPLVEVEATLEVLSPPTTRDLHFWALQVTFADHGRRLGGAHTGLQWHPSAPEGAVNWGGYFPGAGELPGSESALPGVDSPNTRHWAWQPQRRYRIRVHRVPGGWRSTVTDLEDGRSTDVRDLYVDAPELTDVVVWAEVFAPCAVPSAARWSNLRGRTAGGRVVAPRAVSVNYQAAAAGGCPNTNVVVDEVGVVQATATRRTTAQGTVVRLPAS